MKSDRLSAWGLLALFFAGLFFTSRPKVHSGSVTEASREKQPQPATASNIGSVGSTPAEAGKRRFFSKTFFKWAALLVNLLTLVVVLYYTKATYQQVDALHDQIRPWIGIGGEIQNNSEPTLVVTGYKVEPGNPPTLQLSVDLKLHNYGQSPAILAGEPQLAIGQLVKAEPRFWSFDDRTKDLCSRFIPRSGQIGVPQFRIPVFQGTTTTRHLFVNTHLNSQEMPGGKFHWTFLSGCVLYGEGTGDPKKHRTLFIYHLVFPADSAEVLPELDFTEVF